MITAASSTIGASSLTDLTDGTGAKACKQYQHGRNKNAQQATRLNERYS
jgi:hypothetical protein